MNKILIALGGLFWLITYIEIIRKGFEDKTYGMPVPALLANISWEFINSFITPATGVQLYVNYLWLSLDFIIVYQFLKYWKREFKDISLLYFYSFIFISSVAAYLIVFYMSDEFGFILGPTYSSYGINLMMSVLFITMLYRRKSLRGQSIYIALFKMLGTLANIIAYYNSAPEVLSSSILKVLYASIIIFDLIYLILVYVQRKKSLLFSS